MDKLSAEMLSGIAASLRLIRPELVVVGALVAVIFADIFKRRALACGLALAGLAGAGLLLTGQCCGAVPTGLAFQGAYAVDSFASSFKLLFLGAAIVVAVLSWPAIRSWEDGKGEYYTLLLSCTFGMMVMAGANDLLLMYLALEFVSITSYIMAGLLRKNRKSSEASLKYILYGAAASGFMIYGMSYLYGMTGTLEVEEIGRRCAPLGGKLHDALVLVEVSPEDHRRNGGGNPCGL